MQSIGANNSEVSDFKALFNLIKKKVKKILFKKFYLHLKN